MKPYRPMNRIPKLSALLLILSLTFVLHLTAFATPGSGRDPFFTVSVRASFVNKTAVIATAAITVNVSNVGYGGSVADTTYPYATQALCPNLAG